MALANPNLVKDALELIFAQFAEDKTKIGAREGVAALVTVAEKLNAMYVVVESTITADSDDAGVSEWITANAEVAEGAILKMMVDTFDLTDNALGTTKNAASSRGSVVEAGDVYVIDGADSVEYVGFNKLFDADGETTQEFLA